jgi:hypothetical protein
MIFLKAAAKPPPNDDQGACRRSGSVVTYPPPSSGTNYNLIDMVEHDLGDRVTWGVIHSPEGSFTYEYSIKAARRRRKRCPGPECHNFIEPGQRKCIDCQLETRKARNRRYYQLLKARIKTGSP